MPAYDAVRLILVADYICLLDMSLIFFFPLCYMQKSNFDYYCRREPLNFASLQILFSNDAVQPHVNLIYLH